MGNTVTWIIGQFESETDVTAEEWEERLHPDFLEQVPASALVSQINTSIRPAAPFTVTDYEEGELEAVATLAGALGEPFDLKVAIDDDGLIIGMLLAPVEEEERDPATSLGEVTERLDGLPGEVHYLISRDDEVLAERDAAVPAPLGSVFKLYVLGAVAEGVARGELAWDDTLIVTDEVKSLPSGVLQEEPDGTEVTVENAALKMISQSDNTATDMLIDAVGQDALGAAVVAMGNDEPELLRPFLTTQNMFELLWGDEDAAARWDGADVETREQIVSELNARPFTLTVEDAVMTETGWTRGVEWFASADDVSDAHAWLADAAQSDPVITEVLTESPGIQVDGDAWSEVAFKGGNSPGVVAGSWRGVSVDGSALTVVIQIATDDAAAAQEAMTELFGLTEDVFRLES